MRLPGHGTTPRDFAAQTPETIYEGVRAEFEALKGRFEEVDVVGFSMGGSLATLLAAREPVDRLVLIAPYYGVTYKWYYLLPPEAWNGVLGPVLPYVMKPKGSVQLNCPDEKDQVFSYRVIPTKGVETLMDLGRRARRKETLQAVNCPVLMLMSEGDKAASPKEARKAFERIGSSEKTAVWYSRRNNHHLLREWDRENAKQRIVDFLRSF
jgi:carboxylesterase